MKTLTLETYSFDELTPKAKEKARDWFRNGNDFDSECVIDDAKQCLAFLGFDIAKVYFSGFSCQGDGACFQGAWRAARVKPDGLKAHAPQDAELHRLADWFASLAKEMPDAAFFVTHSGHYSHQYCTQFDFSFDDCENPSDAALPKFEKDAIEAARDCMAWIYRQLRNEWKCQNSDEQVDETIRLNEYAFSESGSRFITL